MNVKQISETNNPTLDAVIEYFLRVSKNNNYYHIIKKQLQKQSMADEFSSYKPCGKMKSLLDFKSFLSKLPNITDIDMAKNMSIKNTRYRYIVNLVNYSIHLLMERGGINPSLLGKYGQDIFDLTCYHLYGDAYFDDIKEMDSNQVENVPQDINVFISKKYQEYVSKGGKKTIEQFIKTNSSIKQILQDYEKRFC